MPGIKKEDSFPFFGERAAFFGAGPRKACQTDPRLFYIFVNFMAAKLTADSVAFSSQKS